jgi:PAS domain S-box-containing protein
MERRASMTNPYRILIIEDDPDDVELILLGFSKHDEFFVDVATTGEEGLEKISKTRYDLVSVDFALPGISGLDVLEEIRKTDQDVPVVMVTGRGTEELQVVAFEKYATSYVMKSVDSFRSLPTIFEALISESRFRSEERRMKRDIERSETVSRYILENSPTGIYILQNGCFRMANSKFEEIFGCEKEDLIGEHFWSLADPESFECVEGAEGVAKEDAPGRSIVHEFRINRKDGSKRWVEARIVPLDYQDERWVLGNLVDITERKEGEKDLLTDKRRLLVLYSLTLKAIDFHGETDELMKEALSELMAGLEEFEVGGVFLLEGGRLVLRALAGPLEDLMSFADQIDAEELLKVAKAKMVVEGDRPTFWASVPFCNGEERKGLLVLGREREIDPYFLKFLEDLAWHLGKMVEIFELRRSLSEKA